MKWKTCNKANFQTKSSGHTQAFKEVGSQPTCAIYIRSVEWRKNTSVWIEDVEEQLLTLTHQMSTLCSRGEKNDNRLMQMDIWHRCRAQELLACWFSPGSVFHVLFFLLDRARIHNENQHSRHFHASCLSLC